MAGDNGTPRGVSTADSPVIRHSPDHTAYLDPDVDTGGRMRHGGRATMIPAARRDGSSMGFNALQPGVVHVDPGLPGSSLVDMRQLRSHDVLRAMNNSSYPHEVFAKLGQPPPPPDYGQALAVRDNALRPDTYVVPAAAYDGRTLQENPMATYPPPTPQPPAAPQPAPLPPATLPLAAPAAAPAAPSWAPPPGYPYAWPPPPPPPDPVHGVLGQIMQTMQAMQEKIAHIGNGAATLPYPAAPLSAVATPLRSLAASPARPPAPLPAETDEEPAAPPRARTPRREESLPDSPVAGILGGLETLDLPFLTGPIAEKPRITVLFDLGRSGQQQARYHHVVINSNSVVLVYDNRFDTGGTGPYLPPTRGDQDTPVVLRVGSKNPQQYQVDSLGLQFLLGKLTCILLVRLPDEEGGVPGELADMEDDDGQARRPARRGRAPFGQAGFGPEHQ